jgi:hypothetical protein
MKKGKDRENGKKENHFEKIQKSIERCKEAGREREKEERE